jgi:hypothetical protein
MFVKLNGFNVPHTKSHIAELISPLCFFNNFSISINCYDFSSFVCYCVQDNDTTEEFSQI